jgi:FkbM family methyltransferase
MLVGATAGSLARLTGAGRPTIERLMAEAGLREGDAWQRLRWLVRSAGSLLNGWLRRAAGRAFDRWVGEYRCSGLAFHIPPDLTTLETRAEFLFHRYENVERRFAGKYVPSEATVLELGGCLGVVACLINRRLADPRRHVVFEPHPRIADHLAANRDRNRCRFQIRRQIVAAGGPAAFYLRDPFVGGSSLLRPGDRKIEVPTVTVADLERDTGLRFDTLVVDIEGAEHAFFAENAELLGRARVVLVEFHEQIIGEAACEESRNRLRAAGLQRRDRQGSVEAWSRPAA